MYRYISSDYTIFSFINFHWITLLPLFLTELKIENKNYHEYVGKNEVDRYNIIYVGILEVTFHGVSNTYRPASFFYDISNILKLTYIRVHYDANEAAFQILYIYMPVRMIVAASINILIYVQIWTYVKCKRFSQIERLRPFKTSEIRLWGGNSFLLTSWLYMNKAEELTSLHVFCSFKAINYEVAWCAHTQ